MMRVLRLTVAVAAWILLMLCAAAWGQQGVYGPGVSHTTTNPAGLSCGSGVQPMQYDPSGLLYTCQSGTWTVLAAGGSGVSSITWSLPSWLTASPNPINSAGTQTFSPTTGQTSHQVIGTCGAGTTFAPCALVAGDLISGSGGGTTNFLRADGTWAAPPGGGGGAFSGITSGTNTTAAMLVGTGASLGVTGSGTIGATSAPVSGLTGAGAGVLTWLATPNSANLASAVTDETGSGALVFGTAPTITLTNGTGLPAAGIASIAANTTLANITSGSASPTAASIPSGIQNYVAGTGYNQATTHQLEAPLICADSSASGTAQSCTTSPSFTPAANDCVIYTTTTANTGTGLTLNVNALGAKSVGKWQGNTTLASGDVAANKPVVTCYDGTRWNLSSIANAPTGSGTVNGGTANQIAYYQSTGSAVFGDSLFTDNGTTLSYSGTGGISAGTGTPQWSGTPGTCPTTAASTGAICFSSTGNRPVYGYNAGSNSNILLASDNVAQSLTTTGTSGAATLSGGVLNIPNYATGVSSFSGDSTVLSNSGSTGAVTATLANAAVGTLLGNATSSAAAPTYHTLTAVNGQTATYQVLASDFSAYKTITVASGTFTITLVASGSQPSAGQYIDLINYGSGAVTIARSGQNINGGVGSITLPASSATNPTSTRIISDGTNYFASQITAGTSAGVTSFTGTGIVSNSSSSGAVTIAWTGTSGGVPYFSSTTATGSSALLTANSVVFGGGAGTAPATADLWLAKSYVPANCNNATAGAGFSLPTASAPTVVCRTGTNVQTGYLQFTASQCAQFQDEIPNDWDTASGPYVRVNYTQNGTTASQSIIYTIQSISSSTSDDTAFNTVQTFSTTTTGATANTPYTQSLQLNSTSTTGWAVTQIANFKVCTAAGSNATSNLQMVEITWPHKTPGTAGAQ